MPPHSPRAIPILTFHALENPTTPISFPPALFERAIKKWHAEGWRTISLLDAVRHIQARTAFPPKTFVLTFDDGYASVYQHAFPLLRALNMTATIFIAPNADGNTQARAPLPVLYQRDMLRWNEIRELRARGFHFGAHTLTHRDLTRLADNEIENELRVARDILADALDEKISLFAYPMGKYNARVRTLTAQFYDAACSDKLGIANFNSDVFALERVETFYLRAKWAAEGFTRAWFPLYLGVRNVPRTMKRIVLK